MSSVVSMILSVLLLILLFPLVVEIDFRFCAFFSNFHWFHDFFKAFPLAQHRIIMERLHSTTVLRCPERHQNRRALGQKCGPLESAVWSYHVRFHFPWILSESNIHGKWKSLYVNDFFCAHCELLRSTFFHWSFPRVGILLPWYENATFCPASRLFSWRSCTQEKVMDIWSLFHGLFQHFTLKCKGKLARYSAFQIHASPNTFLICTS